MRFEYSERVPFDPTGTQFIITETCMIDRWCAYDQDDNFLVEGTLDQQYSMATGHTFVLRIFFDEMPESVACFSNRVAYVKVRKVLCDQGERLSPRRKKKVVKRQMDWSKNGF